MTTIKHTGEPVRVRLRGDVDRLVAEGLTEREIARQLDTSRSTVWAIKQDLGLGRKGPKA